MKRIILFAAAFALCMPTLALAAPNKAPHKDHHAGTTKPTTGAKPVRPEKPAHGGGHNRPGHGGGHNRPGNGGGHNRPDRPGNGGGHHNRPHKPGNKPGTRPPHKPGTRPPHRPGNRPGRPGHGYHKPRPSQFYWRGKWLGRIHASLFQYPHGYSYRIWNEGDRLPPLFLSSSYYYDGYAQLGLEAPPPGYRWVRYGPDLLLVDTNTNEVEQVVYGAFY
jgi:Ni/Co efflux regulator RcnB